MEAGKNLTFATPTLRVKAGEAIRLTFNNPDVVPHNWVLDQAGHAPDGRRPGESADRRPGRGGAHYVPTSKDVLALHRRRPPQAEHDDLLPRAEPEGTVSLPLHVSGPLDGDERRDARRGLVPAKWNRRLRTPGYFRIWKWANRASAPQMPHEWVGRRADGAIVLATCPALSSGPRGFGRLWWTIWRRAATMRKHGKKTVFSRVFRHLGGVAERPIAPVLKTGDGESRPRVRIPPPPLRIPSLSLSTPFKQSISDDSPSPFLPVDIFPSVRMSSLAESTVSASLVQVGVQVESVPVARKDWTSLPLAGPTDGTRAIADATSCKPMWAYRSIVSVIVLCRARVWASLGLTPAFTKRVMNVCRRLWKSASAPSASS